MKSKGFVFVETIIVVAILATSLVAIYASFSMTINNEKRRATFDDTSYIYRTYYIEDFLVSLNMENYLNQYLAKNNEDGKQRIIRFNCQDINLYDIDAGNGDINELESQKKGFCETTLDNNTLNVKNIFITNNDIKSLKDCTTKKGLISSSDVCSDYKETLKGVKTNLIHYIRTLPVISDGYRLIIEYEETTLNKNDSKKPKDGKCPALYQFINENNTELCYKKNVKSYFNSVDMVIRSKIEN